MQVENTRMDQFLATLSRVEQQKFQRGIGHLLQFLVDGKPHSLPQLWVCGPNVVSTVVPFLQSAAAQASKERVRLPVIDAKTPESSPLEIVVDRKLPYLLVCPSRLSVDLWLNTLPTPKDEVEVKSEDEKGRKTERSERSKCSEHSVRITRMFREPLDVTADSLSSLPSIAVVDSKNCQSALPIAWLPELVKREQAGERRARVNVSADATFPADMSPAEVTSFAQVCIDTYQDWLVRTL